MNRFCIYLQILESVNAIKKTVNGVIVSLVSSHVVEMISPDECWLDNEILHVCK